MKESFDKLENWLLNSGIVSSSINPSNAGGVHSFYDTKNSSFGFLYPEITGYFVDTMYFLHSLNNNEKYLKLAEISSNWLIQIFEKYNGIIMGIENNRPTKNFSFVFDTGICSTSMFKCFELIKKKKYLDYGLKFLDWIKNDSIENDGTILPFFNHEKQIFEQNSEVWYKQKGCLNIKTCIPFFRYSKISNSSEYLEIGKKICDSYSLFQRNNGSFSLHLNSSITNLHTQCYALEGLLYGYDLTHDQKYLTSCEKSLDWCVKNMEKDGSIRLWFGNKYKSKASYPIAQLIRLMILFDSVNHTSKYKMVTSKLMKFLLRFQAQSDDSRVDGGFYEELRKSIFGWKKNSKINSWGSMFALQALQWYEQYDDLDFHSIKLLY